MRNSSNERGSALLMVLMLVVVFTILGMGLMSMNMSASKQFEKKEEQVKARHQAEMGILHYKEEVKAKVEEYSSSIQSIHLSENFCTSVVGVPQIINGLCQSLKEIVVKSVGGYETILTSFSYNNDELSVDITSTGTAGKEAKIVDATIVIVAPIDGVGTGGVNGGGGNENGAIPKPPTEEVTKVVGPHKIRNGIYEVEGSLHVTGNLIVDPGNNQNGADITIGRDLYLEGGMAIPNHTCMVVQGDLTILGNIETLKAHTYVIVYGNAYINEKLDIKNKAGFYVKGQVSIGNNIDSKAYKNLASIANSCSKWINIPELEPEDIDWFVNPDVNPKYR